MGAPRVSEELERWARAGLIRDDQQEAILAFEDAAAGPTTPAPPAVTQARRIPAVAEALGYLGGMLAVIGLGLIVGHYWPDMATAGRLALSGATAAALLGAGALIRERADPALARLRWFLWLAGTAATALSAAVVAIDALDLTPATTVLLCASSVTITSGVLWAGQDRPLQQLTFLAGLLVTAGALMEQVATGAPVGLAVWAPSAAVLWLGLHRVLGAPVLTEVLGAAGVLVGSVMTAPDAGLGMLFMSATAVGLVAIATVPGLAPGRADRLVLGLLGGFASLQGIPPTVAWFSHDAGALTGLTVGTLGALVLVVGARGLTLLPVPTQVLGGIGLLAGAAVTSTQWHGAAPLLGIATAVALVGLGTRPGHVLLSLLGSVGLLINVPWAVNRFFPGEGRAPLLILVSGALIIVIAVVLTRAGGRLQHDLGSFRRRGPSGGVTPGPAH